jgi:hypothetical protein
MSWKYADFAYLGTGSTLGVPCSKNSQFQSARVVRPWLPLNKVPGPLHALSRVHAKEHARTDLHQALQFGQ